MKRNNRTTHNNQNRRTTTRNIHKNNKEERLEFNAILKDANGDKHEIEGFVVNNEDYFKVVLMIDKIIVLKGCGVRYNSNGEPFLTTPSFKNEKGDFINLVYISDTVLRDSIIELVLDTALGGNDD